MGDDTAAGNGTVRWLLLTGDRRKVIVLLVVGVYLAVVPASLLVPSGDPLLTDRSSVSSLLTTMLSGVILLVSIVVSVASLFVSKEVSPVGRHQERIEASQEFRRQTESVLDQEVSPAQPAEFLRAITRAVLQHAQDLEDAVDDLGGHPGLDEAVPGDLETELREYIDHVAANTRRVDQALQDHGTGSFGMMLAALEYEYAAQLYTLRQIRSRHGEELTGEAAALVEDLEDALQFFLTAREYFKSLYLEREFSYLSSDLLYVSLPAIVLVSYAILAVDLAAIGGASAGVPHVLLFAAGAYTLALSPFAVLTAYILRVATVSRRTLSAGPFLLDGDTAALDVLADD